jgi:hypothetical protein
VASFLPLSRVAALGLAWARRAAFYFLTAREDRVMKRIPEPKRVISRKRYLRT